MFSEIIIFITIMPPLLLLSAFLIFIGEKIRRQGKEFERKAKPAICQIKGYRHPKVVGTKSTPRPIVEILIDGKIYLTDIAIIEIKGKTCTVGTEFEGLYYVVKDDKIAIRYADIKYPLLHEVLTTYLCYFLGVGLPIVVLFVTLL